MAPQPRSGLLFSQGPGAKGGDSQHRSITRSEKFFGKKLMNSAPCSWAKHRRTGELLVFPAAVGFLAVSVSSPCPPPSSWGRSLASSTQTPLQTAAPASPASAWRSEEYSCVMPQQCTVRVIPHADVRCRGPCSWAAWVGRVGSRGLPVLWHPQAGDRGRQGTLCSPLLSGIRAQLQCVSRRLGGGAQLLSFASVGTAPAGGVG